MRAGRSWPYGRWPATCRWATIGPGCPISHRRWFDLLPSAADEVGLPADPEFRSAMVGYLEWGSRLAVINSQDGAEANPEGPMPKWGWGEAKGPYVP